MADTTEHAAAFEAYLAERGMTPLEYQGLPENMRQYMQEAWQFEHHIVAAPPELLADAPDEAPEHAVVAANRPAMSLPAATLPLSSLVTWVTLACVLLLVVFLLVRSN